MAELIPSVIDRLEKAVRLESLGELERARISYRAVVDQNPEAPEALSLLGQLECRLGDHNAAVFHLRRAARLAPGRPDIHLGLGNALNNAGENRAALQSYLDAVRADPEFAPGYVSLGRVLVQNGQYEKALRVFERARQLDPSYPQVHYELGVFFKARGRIEPAIAALLNCIRLDADYENAHFEIAELFILQAAYTDALKHLRCHLQKNPADADALAARAIACRGITRLDEAEESVQQALQLNPVHSLALTQLGHICLERADRPGAQRAYHAALAATQNNSEAHAGLAGVHALQGQEKAAVKHLSGAGNPRHHDLPTLRAYCRALQTLNRTGRAIGLLVERLERRSDSAAGRSSCHYLLGDLHAARGDFPDAFRHYQNANALQVKSFDRDAFDELLTRSLSFFTPAKVTRLSRARTALRPIFFIGLPGAALQLIRGLLTQHADVQCTNGSFTLADMAATLPAHLGTPRAYPDALSAARGSELDALAERFLHQNFRSSQSRTLLDHSVDNWMYLGLAAQLFPGMRVIRLVSSPLFAGMDIFCHELHAPASGYASGLRNIGCVTRGYVKLMDHWQDLNEFNSLEVRLDSLISNPRALSRRIFAYAGLEWRPEFADFFDQRVTDRTRLQQLRDMQERFRAFRPFANDFLLA